MPLPTASTPDVPVQNVFQATTLNSTGLNAQFPLFDALLAIVNTISARIPTAVDDFMAYAVAMTTFITAITTRIPPAVDGFAAYVVAMTTFMNAISDNLQTLLNDAIAHVVAFTAMLSVLTTLLSKTTILLNNVTDKVSQALDAIISATNMVPQALNSVISYLSSFILHTVDLESLKKYFRIMASVDGNMITPDAPPTNPVRLGSSIVLTALVPLPGAKLPLDTGSMVELPVASTVTLQWHIRLADTETDLRPALTPDDQGGAYQCISGSLTSPVLEIVPWPDASHVLQTDGSILPSATQRKFAAFLEVRIWWPGLDKPTKVQTDPISFTVDSWNSILVKDPSLVPGAVKWDTPTADSNPGHFFNNMFSVSIDTPTPSLGSFIQASIKQASPQSLLPQTITSIVQSDPELKVNAGIDVSAMLDTILDTMKSIIAPITGQSNASFNVPPDVQGILSKVLSIPVAVAISGSNISKTIVPSAPMALPNLASTVGGAGIGGVIPLGSLSTKIETLIDEDHLVIQEVDGIFRSGLAFLPIPTYSAYNDNGEVLNKGALRNININIKVSLMVPGATLPLTLLSPVGNIGIKLPVIPVPQVAMFFSDPLSNTTDQGFLLTTDPTTWAVAPTSETIYKLLKDLESILEIFTDLGWRYPTLRSSAPFQLLHLGLDDTQGFVSVMKDMISEFDKATNKNRVIQLLKTFDDHRTNIEIPSPYWQWSANHENTSISALMWIGVPDNGGFCMSLNLNNLSNLPYAAMYFPNRASGISSVKFSGPNLITNGVVYLPGKVPVTASTTAQWDDSIYAIEWDRV